MTRKSKPIAVRVYPIGRDIPIVTFYCTSNEHVDRIKNRYSEYYITTRKENEPVKQPSEPYRGSIKLYNLFKN